MTCVDWFNQRRLYDEITDDAGYTTPAGHKAAYYRPYALNLGVVCW